MSALLTENLPLLAGAPNGIQKLRELILELAVRGKLVAQDPSDEPASELLKRIAEEKARLVAEGKIRKQKSLAEVGEEERPFELPEGWEWTRLGSHVVESGAGWSPSCEPRPREGDEWGVLKVSAVSWGVYQPEENKALPANLDARPEHEVAEGDFLVSRANTAELVARSVVVEATPSRLMLSDKIVRLKLTDCCDRRYVNLVNSAPLARQYYARVAGGTSSSMKNVSREQILNLPIAVPPLAEQHRIVAKVDELIALCDRLEARQADAESAHARLVQALLDSLTQARDADDFAVSWQRLAEHFHSLFTSESSIDALKQTLLQLAVMGKLVPQDPSDEPASELLKRIAEQKARLVAEGKIKKQKLSAEVASEELPFELPVRWSWARFGDLCVLITSGSRGWNEYYSEAGSTFIRSQDIKTDKLNFDNRAFVTLPESSEGVRTRVECGDILITITGANVAKAALIEDHLDDAYVSQHVALIRLAETSLGIFVHRWLVNSHGGRRLLLSSSYGAKPGLNLNNIRDLLVPIPPLPEQHRIVAKVDQLMSLCDQLKSRLTTARQLHERLAGVLVEQAVA